MKTNNRVRQKKKRAHALLTPASGVKEYLSGSGMLMLSVACVLFSCGQIYMSSVESVGGSGIIAALGSIGSLLLSAGIVFCSICSIIEWTKIALVNIGNGICIAGLALMFVYDVLGIVNESDMLGFLQGLSMLVFIASCGILCVLLIISSFGVKLSPAFGLLPSASGVLALILLLVRTATAFTSLRTAIGTPPVWSLADELPQERVWILRSVGTNPTYAGDMFVARLIQCIALMLLIFFALSVLFRYKTFFTEFNSRLSIAREIPVLLKQIEPEEDDDEEEEDPADAYYDGFETLDADPFGDSFDRREERFVERIRQPGGGTQRDGIGVGDGNAANRSPARRQRQRQSSVETKAARSNTPTDDVITDAPVRNSETGAYRVKLRPVPNPNAPKKIPDPSDPSIWDNYAD